MGREKGKWLQETGIPQERNLGSPRCGCKDSFLPHFLPLPTGQRGPSAWDAVFANGPSEGAARFSGRTQMLQLRGCPGSGFLTKLPVINPGTAHLASGCPDMPGAH